MSFLRNEASVRRPRLRMPAAAAVLVLYAGVSFAYFGWRLLPHPGRRLVGAEGNHDPEIFVWSFAWWPHAILHGLNPFYAHAVYAPTGVNLMWVTSVPGLAVAFSPLTLLAGPTVSYNVAAVLVPALSAWTAFLLCRELTRSTWGAIVGGYLYGFSSYILGHQLGGHLHLTAAFLVPLVVLVVVRFVRGRLSRVGLAWRLGLLFACQCTISSEVWLTLTIAGAVALPLAFALVPAARPRLVSSLVPVASAYAIAAVLTAPLLYYALTGRYPMSIAYPWTSSADPLNVVIPTRVTGIGGESLTSISSRFPSNDTERPAYLGAPVLLIVALFLLRRPWAPSTRLLVALFGATAFLSLGTALHVDGRRLFWLPWTPISHLTVFENIAPDRFFLYSTLAVCVLVSSWVATTKGKVFRRPYVLPVLAVAAVVPLVWKPYDVQHPKRLAFFSDGAYKRCIPRGERLMIFPFARWGDSLLWQAESNFWFEMDEGALGPTNLPESFAGDPTVNKLLFSFLPPSPRPTMSELRGLVRRRHVDRIVSLTGPPDPFYGDQYPSPSQLAELGRVATVDDVAVAPACGASPFG